MRAGTLGDEVGGEFVEITLVALSDGFERPVRNIEDPEDVPMVLFDLVGAGAADMGEFEGRRLVARFSALLSTKHGCYWYSFV